MIKQISTITLFLSLVLGFTSCDNSVIFEENQGFEYNTWRYEDVKTFSFSITDSMKPCKIFLNMRTTLDYEFSNIYMNLYSNYPNGVKDTSALEFFLAEPNGKWLGKVSGTVIENKAMIMKGYLTVPGTYTFKLEQAMFDNDLDEIIDIGIRVENLTTEDI